MLTSFRENLRYMPGFVLPEEVCFALAAEGIEAGDLVVVAVPSGAVREAASFIRAESPLVLLASKGLEVTTGKLLTDVILEVIPKARSGAISGPNLAVEIVRG